MTCSKALIVTATLTLLSACGQSVGDRAITGGALGAGTGALLGVATGGSVGGAALLGGAAGAVAGAVTTPQQIYVGEPVYYY